MFGQNHDQYIVELKENSALGTIQKTNNSDGTINISTSVPEFSALVNTKSVYSLEKAFPTSVTPRLQRVYLMKIDKTSNVSDFTNSTDLANFVLDSQDDVLIPDELRTTAPVSNPVDFPNDYIDVITGVDNTSLDIIKAPLAWTITTGDPSILVGVADSSFKMDHYDLEGQIIDNIIVNPNTISHGTGSAGKIAAITDNDLGIASLAHNLKMVGATCGAGAMGLIDGMLELSQYPGVRVINCSFAIPDGHWSIPYLTEVMEEIKAISDVLIVAGAGNSNPNPNLYHYPASYDNAISVTSVGHRYPIGFFHNLLQPDGTRFWTDSWEDCHYERPAFSQGGHIRNDKVNVTSPGYLVTTITDKDGYPQGYGIFNGTSGATNFVSALAGLVFSVNPALTATEVKNIIETTADDIYHIPYNQDFIGQLGTGRINAYAAVKKAECTLNPNGGLDLAMQDAKLDSFEEPFTETDVLWQSEDIWVRNENDGTYIKDHQNPEYSAINPNYVYVRVTNNSCETSTGNEQMKLYWSKANTSLQWPLHWDGSLTIPDPVTNQDVLMGNEIGTLNIPVLEPGQSKIIEYPWMVPNPEDYININENPWHFCLLARMVSPLDSMTVTEGTSVWQNTRKNNNIAWKNTSVVDILPDTTPSPATLTGAAVAIGNPFTSSKSYRLELIKEDNETGKALYEEAEISITMDDVVFNGWQQGGNVKSQLENTKADKTKIVLDNNAVLDNISLPPNAIATVYLQFNFLTKKSTSKQKFTYHLIQRDVATNEVIGGETFVVNKLFQNSFLADAGSDEEIEKNESITLSGNGMSNAVYNWYDEEGNLIYTGKDMTVSPEFTEKYKLEIISEIDGFKDYDEVEVKVNPYKLESLVPNPVVSLLTVNYIADEASSGYIMLIDTNTGSSNNYIIDPQETTISIDVSNYATGNYAATLVCNGEVQESKSFVKQ